LSEALKRLREANRREVKLDNGDRPPILVGYHLPDIQECLLAGDIPLPALGNLPKDPKAEDIAKGLEDAGVMHEMMVANIAFTYRLVGAMLDDIDGEPVTDDRLELAKAFTPEQRERLFAIAQRQEDPDSGEA
jgi:hypothetical protein